ncbi:MAG TPA: ATP-binding protein [Mycobacteriales bacterium]|nr:ATP-binding protein [Mycobacteriales bacterium]
MAATSELLAKLTSIDAVDDPRGRQLRLARLLGVALLPFVFLIIVAPSLGMLALVGVPPFFAVAWWLIAKAADAQQERATALATELTNAELVRAREQVEQRQAASSLLTNLARRNQSLLNRQLAKIDQLEAQEQDSEALAQLFTLDHLATRMRRNAESLLVLSGEEPPRRWGQPVALSDIARGAIAEIEDYTRIDVAPGLDVMVAGRAVGDLVHLVAELLENAATFSPPTTRVLLAGAPTPDGGFIATISDAGIGMSDEELVAANRTLAEAPQVGLQLSGMLGFHVVARLAARYGVRVWLTRGMAGGLVAMIALPADILGSDAAPAAMPAPPMAAAPAGQPAFSAPLAAAPVPVAPVPLTPAAAATLTGGVPETVTPPVAAPLPVPSAVPVDVPPYPMPVADAPVAPAAFVDPGYDPLTSAVPPQTDAPASPLGDELAHATLAPVPDVPAPTFVFHESSMYDQVPIADEAAVAAEYAPEQPEPYRFPVVDLPPVEDAPAHITPPAYEAPDVEAPVFEAPVFEAPAVETPVFEAPPVHAVPAVAEAPVPAPEPVAAPAAEVAPEPIAPVVPLPVADVPAQPGAPEVSATTPGGLARRVPRASLSPHLTQQPVEDVVPEQADQGGAERTSSMLSAFQSGIAAGRLGGEDVPPAGGQ